MFRILPAAVTALGLSHGAAHAATIGGLTFDDNAFADGAAVAFTSPGGTPAAGATGANGAADGDFSTASNINDSVVELFFTDNVLVNGPGVDLVLYQGTNNNVILLTDSASFGGSVAGGTFLEFLAASDPANTSGFTIGAIGFDLSDLGFAAGAELSDGIFIRRGGVFSTVWDAAALNSRDVTPVDPVDVVPLPASAFLLLGSLAALGGWRRRR